MTNNIEKLKKIESLKAAYSSHEGWQKYNLLGRVSSLLSLKEPNGSKRIPLEEEIEVAFNGVFEKFLSKSFFKIEEKEDVLELVKWNLM